MSLRDDLIAAKALIDTPEKWRKGGGNGVTCFCAATALNETGDPASGFDALWAALPGSFKSDPRGFGRIRYIFRFNDHPDTRHADVMALFDRAIASTPLSDQSNGEG